MIAKRNKKGLLLASEMVKIVISVIAIGFLVYLLTMIYFSKVAEQKQIEAKKILTDTSNVESIASIINQINKGEIPGKAKSREILNPKGWYIFAFTVAGERPNECANENCICICENVIDVFNRQIKTCDAEGACLRIENLDPNANKIFGDEGIKINPETPHTSILIKHNDASNLFQITDTTGK